MTFRRALLLPALATLALTGAGCGDPDEGGGIVPSTGTDGQTTPATVPNGPGTPSTDSGASTPATTSSTATGATPAPGSDEEPQGEDEQKSGADDEGSSTGTTP